MSFKQELYQQFVEHKRSRHASLLDPPSLRRRTILRAFLDLPDDRAVTLDSSILLLRRVGVVRCLQSVQDIVGIMERKKRAAEGWGSEQELLQCRLIYFLWAVIEQETIEMREFKQVLLTLAEENGQRVEAIRRGYGDKEGVEELVQVWDGVMQCWQGERVHESIGDISIIISKNQGHPQSNKENLSDFQDDAASSRHRTHHPNSLQKSFSRRDSKGKLTASRSSSKMGCRRTDSTAPPSSVKTGYLGESLSTAQEKSLVSRLYRCDQYRQREELKRQTQQERMQAQLKQCSFKPNIDKSRPVSRGRIAGQVRGYEKAVGRLKSGYKKSCEMKESLQYRIWPKGKPAGYTSSSRVCPPAFLSRTKDSSPELFQIVFTIARKSIRVKIRECDKISEIVDNIGQIYALKEDSRQYIRGIIEEELNNYYETRMQQEENDNS